MLQKWQETEIEVQVSMERAYDFHGVDAGREAFFFSQRESKVSNSPDVRRIVRRVVPAHRHLHQVLRLLHCFSSRHFPLLRFVAHAPPRLTGDGTERVKTHRVLAATDISSFEFFFSLFEG